MAGYNGLEIHQIHEILNGGGLEYTSEQRSKKKEKAKQTIDRFIELGWSKKFLKEKFHALNDSILEQWPIELFIKEYIKHFVKEIDIDDSIFNNLKKIGLKTKVAEHLTTLLNPLKDTCFTDTQLVNKAVENLLGYSEQLAKETAKHYFKPNQINKWFSVKSYEPKIMNIPYRCLTVDIISYIENIAISSVLPDADSELYFHSTSWTSCISILNGIARTKGRTCLDFGQEPGFYMSPTLQDSIDWTIKNSRNNFNEDALIIFNLPKKFPDELKFKKLKGKEWASVTKKSRRCKSKYYENILEIHKCGLLYGNMVANVNEVEKGGDPQTHNPPKKQLVSKRDVSNDFIHQRIIGCLFFQKHK